jgi:hypothetical protein
VSGGVTGNLAADIKYNGGADAGTLPVFRKISVLDVVKFQEFQI